MRNFLFWVVWHVPFVPFRPLVLGIALGARPRRIK